MNKHTAEMVAFIGQQVRTQWLGLPKTARLETIYNALHNSDHKPAAMHYDKTILHADVITGLNSKELIYLTIDGQLGIYFPNEDDTDRYSPIRIELLKPRRVRITKTFEVDIQCIGDESEATLFRYADEANQELVDIKYEEIT